MPHVFSIGHSRHPIGEFLSLLERHEIKVLADVRSMPYSRFSPQFNRNALQRAVEAAGMRYVFLGKELGGKPDDDAFYDRTGHVLYGRLAGSPGFAGGIERLESELAGSRVAMLCAEENPEHCHRRVLIGRVLAERGVAIDHIRGDGQIEPESKLARDARQTALFGSSDETWRSSHPARRSSHPVQKRHGRT